MNGFEDHITEPRIRNPITPTESPLKPVPLDLDGNTFIDENTDDIEHIQMREHSPLPQPLVTKYIPNNGTIKSPEIKKEIKLLDKLQSKRSILVHSYQPDVNKKDIKDEDAIPETKRLPLNSSKFLLREIQEIENEKFNANKATKLLTKKDLTEIQKKTCSVLNFKPEDRIYDHINFHNDLTEKVASKSKIYKSPIKSQSELEKPDIDKIIKDQGIWDQYQDTLLDFPELPVTFEMPDVIHLEIDSKPMDLAQEWLAKESTLYK